MREIVVIRIFTTDRHVGTKRSLYLLFMDNRGPFTCIVILLIKTYMRHLQVRHVGQSLSGLHLAIGLKGPRQPIKTRARIL